MFKDENEFRDFISDLPYDDTPDIAHRDHLEKQLLRSLDEKEVQQPVANRKICRLVMLKRIIPAAAACFILIVGGLLGYGLSRSRTLPEPETTERTKLPIQISQLEGTVLVKHQRGNGWEELIQQAPIYLGDRFATVGKATMTLSLEDKSTLTLDDNCSLSIDEYNDQLEFGLTHGSVKAVLESPHSPFFINTPQGKLEAVGTEFMVTVK